MMIWTFAVPSIAGLFTHDEAFRLIEVTRGVVYPLAGEAVLWDPRKHVVYELLDRPYSDDEDAQLSMTLTGKILALSETQGWLLLQALKAVRFNSGVPLGAVMVAVGLVPDELTTTEPELTHGVYHTCIQRSCGHEEMLGLVDPKEPRRCLLNDPPEEDCMDCRVMRAHEESVALNLPKLQGSPLGITWAASIRQHFLEGPRLHLTKTAAAKEPTPEQVLRELRRAHMTTINDSVWWVVNEGRVSDDTNEAAIGLATLDQIPDLSCHTSKKVRRLAFDHLGTS